MSKRERISSVDTAWLRMDRPTNLMMIVGVLMFDGPLDFARLRRTVAARLVAPYSRFRQKALVETAGAWWEDDPDFDLDAHLHRVALPGRQDQEELQTLVAELASTPLSPAKALWEFHLVEKYDGGAALIMRIHHCIADGIALVGVMLSLTDDRPDAPEPEMPEARLPRAGDDNPWRQLLDPLTQTAVSAIHLGTQAWVKYFQLLAEPGQMVDYGRQGMGYAAELAKLLALPKDSPSRFKGKPGGSKAVAWSEPLPLAEVKAVGRPLGCSVNDILLASVAGALRGYLIEKGDAVDGIEVRGLVPVNLRTESDQGKLGNRFGLVTLLLPVYEGNPLARLYEVKRRMNELKGSFQAPLSLAILAAVGMAPKVVQEQFLDILSAKASAVMTNVPGPQQPLYLAGARMAQPMFWVPQSGDIGIGVSILSYANNVQFGLITDRHFVPDPASIAGRFRNEFEKLLFALMLEPWDEVRDPAVVEQSLEQEWAQINRDLQPSPAPARRPRKPRSAAAPRAAKSTTRAKLG